MTFSCLSPSHLSSTTHIICCFYLLYSFEMMVFVAFEYTEYRLRRFHPTHLYKVEYNHTALTTSHHVFSFHSRFPGSNPEVTCSTLRSYVVLFLCVGTIHTRLNNSWVWPSMSLTFDQSLGSRFPVRLSNLVSFVCGDSAIKERYSAATCHKWRGYAYC